MKKVKKTEELTFLEKTRWYKAPWKVTNILKIKGFFLTLDKEKTFYSVKHLFIFYVWGKFGFGNNFIKWIKILLILKVFNRFSKISGLKPNKRKTILIAMLSIYDHHLKKYQFFSLNKLSNRELYTNHQ